MNSKAHYSLDAINAGIAYAAYLAHRATLEQINRSCRAVGLPETAPPVSINACGRRVYEEVCRLLPRGVVRTAAGERNAVLAQLFEMRRRWSA